MEKRDYYEILGITKSADKAEIKKAFRKLAKLKHPDRNKSENADQEFKELQEAYEILSDENKRKAYDQYGHAGTQGFGGNAGYGGFNGQSGFEGYSDLGDIFSQFFGQDFGGFGFSGSQQRASNTRGADIEAVLRIDFEEAVFGKYKTISYKLKNKCQNCDGLGAESPKDVKTCDTCKGSGRVTNIQRTFLGTIQTASVCPTCSGSGRIITKACRKCSGDGRVDSEENFKIKIPPGIPDGVTLRFTGRGNAGKKGGTAGDLYLTIEVEPDKELERRGDDIYSTINIDVHTAVLGKEIEIRSVRGDMTLEIPSGTQPGKIFRLSGKAGPKFRGKGNGDHYVQVNVKVPEKLNRTQRKLWEELADNATKQKGIFG